MQVYKQLKILSARPDPKKYQKIRHHLYGFVSVKENFSTGSWYKLAAKKIKDINQKGKIALVVGGICQSGIELCYKLYLIVGDSSKVKPT